VAGGSQRRYTLDDYFAVEAGSPIRHEYANGALFRSKARARARAGCPRKAMSLSPNVVCLPAPGSQVQSVAIVMAISFEEACMRFASVAEVKNNLSAYLNRARSRNEPIIVTHHGKPYALIQPLSEKDLEALSWGRLAERRLREAWDGEDDALYDYL